MSLIDHPVAEFLTLDDGRRTVVIADAGHLPQHGQPGAFRAVLLNWLAAT